MIEQRKDRLRRIIIGFQGNRFTTVDIREKASIENLLPLLGEMAEQAEIKWCGKTKSKKIPVDIWQELKLKALANPKESKSLCKKYLAEPTDLPGWRKIFPELFCDPGLPGNHRVGHYSAMEKD